MDVSHLITGNDTLQRHVASEKEALLVVSPYARLAIEKEILPQIEGGVTDDVSVVVLLKDAKQSVRDGFNAKNQVYTRLTSYKTIDQSDAQFLEDCLKSLDEWAAKTRNEIKPLPTESSEEERVQVIPVPSPADSRDIPDIDQNDFDPFDLGELRL